MIRRDCGLAGRRLLMGAAALLLAGCSAAADACTLVGCESLVSVALDLPAGTSGHVDVELCVAERCETTVTVDASSGEPAQLTALQVIDRQRVPLTVRATQHGRVLAVGTRTVHLQRLAPNGETCGPICYRGDFQLGPGGLAAAPAPLASQSSGPT
jgi:hypothetical protein